MEADDAAVSLGTIAETLSGGAVLGDTEASVGGYAASGHSVRGAIEALAALAPLTLHDDGARLRLDPPGEPVAIDLEELGAAAGGERRPRLELDRQASGTLPDEVAIGYYDGSRDYQAGLQRARRGGPGRRVDSIDLPAVLDAGEAKLAAERRLAQAWAERLRLTLRLPPRRLGLRPGGMVRVPGRGETFRIAGWMLERMVLEITGTGVAGMPQLALPAAPGRPTREEDAPAGATVLALLDLPPLDDAAAATPRLWIAAAGTGAGWRRAQLLASVDGGASYQALGQTAAPAVIGTALTVLSPGEAALFDRVASLEVELANASMWVKGRDDDALVGGANLAMLGEELIQFGTAEPIGERRFRLGRLVRGRRGSEWAMTTHAAGERFVLLEAAALLPFDVPSAALGGEVRVLAVGVGDDAGVIGEATFVGRSLRPPAPVHLSASRLADGTIRIGWVRRSRNGWAWLDGSDTPLGEESERYRLTITPSVGIARTAETTSPSYDYTPALQAADGAGSAGAIDVALAQIGAVAPSQPAAAAQFTL